VALVAELAEVRVRIAAAEEDRATEEATPDLRSATTSLSGWTAAPSPAAAAASSPAATAVTPPPAWIPPPPVAVPPTTPEDFSAFWQSESVSARVLPRQQGMAEGIGTALLPMVALMLLLIVVLAWIG
jgi:hypothetical protein